MTQYRDNPWLGLVSQSDTFDIVNSAGPVTGDVGLGVGVAPFVDKSGRVGDVQPHITDTANSSTNPQRIGHLLTPDSEKRRQML